MAYAGIPVTDRRCASSVAFATGHGEGDKAVDLRGLAASADTIVVYMGLQRIKEVVAELIAGGRSPGEPAAVVANGTYEDQRVVAAPLVHLADAVAGEGVSAPAVIVVGDVVRLRAQLSWFGSEPPGPCAREFPSTRLTRTKTPVHVAYAMLPDGPARFLRR